MKIPDVIRMLLKDGWYLVATKGSRRQFKHASKPGRVTVAGHPGDDLARGTLNSVFRIVVEKAKRNFSAYSPDLPGCIATGRTRAEAERNMIEAIRLHLAGMRRDGQPIPRGECFAEVVAVE